jgi:hypothetical protein
VPSSTSSSESTATAPLFNRFFAVTLAVLLVLLELAVRWVPSADPRLFRAVYGNALSMFMTVRERLEDDASAIRVLALGDSLAMTQFQPSLFAKMTHLQDGEVFNAAYLGMSFPSQLDMIQSIGLDRFSRIEKVLYFVNPRRLSIDEVANTDVLRVGVRPAGVPWHDAWESKTLGPILDGSRLYGLSKHLVGSSWRTLLFDTPSWDHIEYLGRFGGVAWAAPRANGAAPIYPYPRLEAVSPRHLADMRTTLQTLRSLGAEIWLLPSAVHPDVDPFASAQARASYVAALEQTARAIDARFAANLLAEFVVRDDRVFCDYGHMNADGGAEYTSHLVRSNLVSVYARGTP